MRGLAALVLVAAATAGCGGAHDARPPTAWQSVATPTLPGTALLAGVSCLSRSFCVAVGSHLQKLVSHTLVERWDGSAWAVVPTSNPEDRRSNLTGVSCVTPSFCAAVGSHFTGGGSHGLIELWDGRSWRVTPSSSPALTDVLSGVSCTSESFCVAVGTTRGGAPQTFVQIWRGHAWSTMRSPS